MDGMPRLIQPNHPQEIEYAIEILGNRAHAVILRHLSQIGPSTTGEILKGVTLGGGKKLTRPSLQHHLKALELSGAISADQPAGQRHGRRVKYTASMDNIEFALIPAYVQYLRGK